MSNEKKSVLNRISSLPRTQKLLFAGLIVCLIASASVAGAALINGNSLFGAPTTGPQSLSPTPAPTATPVPTASPSPSPSPVPIYHGTVGSVTWIDNAHPSVNNPSTIVTGATLTLSTTISPTSSKAQEVWFYYSDSPIAVNGNGIPTNPDQLVGIDTATISPGGTTASVSFHVSIDAQWYFIAEIPVPA